MPPCARPPSPQHAQRVVRLDPPPLCRCHWKPATPLHFCSTCPPHAHAHVAHPSLVCALLARRSAHVCKHLTHKGGLLAG